MLNLAGFNSTIYSFNNKTWVSLTPTPLSFKWVQCPVTRVPEKGADPWVARIHMGIARVALLGEEGPGPDEDIIQPALHRRGRRQVQIVEIEI